MFGRLHFTRSYTIHIHNFIKTHGIHHSPQQQAEPRDNKRNPERKNRTKRPSIQLK